MKTTKRQAKKSFATPRSAYSAEELRLRRLEASLRSTGFILLLIMLITSTCGMAMTTTPVGDLEYNVSADNADFESRNRQKGIYTITSGTIDADYSSSCPLWVAVIDRDGTDGGHLTVKINSCIVSGYTVYTRAQCGGTGPVADLEPNDVFIEWDEDAGHGSLGYFHFSGECVEETPYYVQVTGEGSTNWTVYRVISSGTLTKTKDGFNEHDAIHLVAGPCPVLLEKFDDINDCVWLGGEINYKIDYNYPGGPNCPNINDVNLIDELPGEVNYVSSDPCGSYDSNSHTVTWDLDTLEPNESGYVTLEVEVKENVELGAIITNKCELKSDAQFLRSAYEYTTVCCRIIYVDEDANGYNNGVSWKDAYNYLQNALEDANTSAGCEEIRVAEGTYNPDQNSIYPNGTGERTATFELIGGVELYGGYAGFGEPDPNARDIKQYETILSGDLGRNDRPCVDPCDLLSDPCRADNSYHVVTGSGTDETAELDGFAITGGNANGDDSYNSGGGMYNDSGSPTVRNCTFRWNSAEYGGGMYNTGGSPTITNCAFVGNGAGNGGGVYDTGESPTITNCTFVANSADSGSGIYEYMSSLKVTNCILWGNRDEQIELLGGNALVTYSDIKGGWEGEGNIDENPMLVADGYHLTLCSPCIDAGTNTPGGSLPLEDIDGEYRIMDGNCDGEAIVDMGVDEYYLADCNILEFAHCPRPASGVTDVPRNVVLSWTAGINANSVDGHRVYFDPNEQKVIDRSGCEVNGVNTTDPCYSLPTPLAPLELGWIYYWAVDEVNSPNTWKGDVWHFRTRNYLVVEDFELYADNDALHEVWKEEAEEGTGAVISLETGVVRDDKSMKYEYHNADYPLNYSEVVADVNDDWPSEIGSNWTAENVKALVLYFYGQSGNYIVEQQMYVKLTDADSNEGIVIYGDNDEDVNDLTVEKWQEWNINLALFDACGVDLTDVNKITIGFDEPANTGEGTVYFDDIRLYPPRCRLSERTADFTKVDYAPAGDPAGDCVIDYREIRVMARDWLMGPPPDPNVDLYGDGTIDFRDFAILANRWLEEQLWP